MSSFDELGRPECFEASINARQVNAKRVCANEGSFRNLTVDNLAGDNVVVNNFVGDSITANNLFFNLASNFWLIEDQKPSGTPGGHLLSLPAVVGDPPVWTKRDLNTIVGTGPSVTLDLGTSEMVFQPGTYFIQGRFPAYSVDSHKTRLVRSSDSFPVKYSANSFASDNASHMTDSLLQAIVNVTVADDRYYVEHIAELPSLLTGAGTPTSSLAFTLDPAIPEIYSTVNVFQINNTA